MAAYALDIFDNSGKAVVPGASMAPGECLYYSHSPVPVPDVGETLEMFGKKWRVNRRVFHYDYEIPDRGDREPAVKINLFCSPG